MLKDFNTLSAPPISTPAVQEKRYISAGIIRMVIVMIEITDFLFVDLLKLTLIRVFLISDFT